MIGFSKKKVPTKRMTKRWQRHPAYDTSSFQLPLPKEGLPGHAGQKLGRRSRTCDESARKARHAVQLARTQMLLQRPNIPRSAEQQVKLANRGTARFEGAGMLVAWGEIICASLTELVRLAS